MGFEIESTGAELTVKTHWCLTSSVVTLKMCELHLVRLSSLGGLGEDFIKLRIGVPFRLFFSLFS